MLYKIFCTFCCNKKKICVKYLYLRKSIFPETKKEKKLYVTNTFFWYKLPLFALGNHFFFSRRYVMYSNIFSSSDIKGSMGRRLYYATKTKVSDNEIRFKWLFRWRSFIIKRNNCGKFVTPVYMPHMLYFERLTIGGIC